MTKARDLADLISAGNPLADGSISASEVTGLNTVATSGAYSDLSGTPTLGTAAALDVGTGVQAYDANLTSFVSAFTLPTSDGTADQILKTNGSGTIAFADAGGGGAQFDFTAEGSITAGNVVSLTSTGKATQTTIDVVGSLQTYPGTSITAALSHDIAACPRTGRMLLLAGVSGGIQFAGVTESGGTLTYGSLSNIYSADPECMSVVPTGRIDGEFVVVFRRSSTRYLAARVVVVSATRTLTVSALYNIYSGARTTLSPGSAVLASPSSTTSPSIVVLHEFQGGSGYDEACVTSIQVSSSGTLSGSQQITALSGSGGTNANVTNDEFTTAYDETNDRVIGGFKTNGNTAYLYAFSISGTTITQLGTTNWSATQAIDMVYDGSKNYGVYIGGTAAGTTEVDSFTFDGSNFSRSGSPVTVQTGGYDARTSDITYDSTLGIFVIRAVKTSGSGFKHWHTTGSFDSAGSITLNNAEGAATVPFSSDPAIENTRHYGGYNPVNGVLVLMHRTSSSAEVEAYTYTLGNSANYLGIADTSASDGQTVTVNLKGSVDQNQTGLTAGTIYSAGQNGALATTGTRVGKALSATAILITD
jgi:hypothetical protein